MKKLRARDYLEKSVQGPAGQSEESLPGPSVSAMWTGQVLLCVSLRETENVLHYSDSPTK